jgi:energy-coupling factor transporter ATP-binding protein EcfA2
VLTSFPGIAHSEVSEDLLLRDYGKYADLISGLHSRRSEVNPSRSSLAVQPVVELKACNPGLVSIVGETGAGKSTLVKLLILSTCPPSSDDQFPTPVAGIPGQHIPTSAGIHLYADPQTLASAKPILYADCEGLDGGATEPRAAMHRRRRLGSIDSTPLSEMSAESSSCVERRLAWANDDEKRSRAFVVTQPYHRILFAFSDVVVFVHLNPRSAYPHCQARELD